MPLPSSVYRWRPHPWHGLEAGADAPRVVLAYIEITPFDSIKYEVDKTTGYLRVDRPQRTSSLPPTLYGFVPQTYCGRRVGELMPGAHYGDRDPLDICVISERAINRSEVILRARVIGGLPMLDKGEADDKIVAILDNDHLWAEIDDIAQLPPVLLERLRHYFETYKLVPGKGTPVTIGPAYDRVRAQQIIAAALEDYQEEFGAAVED